MPLSFSFVWNLWIDFGKKNFIFGVDFAESCDFSEILCYLSHLVVASLSPFISFSSLCHPLSPLSSTNGVWVIGSDPADDRSGSDICNGNQVRSDHLRATRPVDRPLLTSFPLLSKRDPKFIRKSRFRGYFNRVSPNTQNTASILQLLITDDQVDGSGDGERPGDSTQRPRRWTWGFQVGFQLSWEEFFGTCLFHNKKVAFFFFWKLGWSCSSFDALFTCLKWYNREMEHHFA